MNRWGRRLAIVFVCLIAGCSDPDASQKSGTSSGTGGEGANSQDGTPIDLKGLKGTIKVDGSSTVYLVTEAVAAVFQKSSRVKVTVGISGTEGGFKKFC